MSTLDITELYNPKHNLKRFFEKIEVEKIPDENGFLMKIYWKDSRCRVDSYNHCNSIVEENGTCWAVCVFIDVSDDFLMSESEKLARSKPRCEVLTVPQGISKIVLDRIRRTGELILNGMEADIR